MNQISCDIKRITLASYVYSHGENCDIAGTLNIHN